ncbi:MAG: alpha/beta fold hydrolase, partial [Rhodoglobus sp.]|nr:alpha/beta fold hydrolase [Rhodoglobus sp.]
MTEYTSLWLMMAEQDFEQRWLDIDGVRTRVAISGPGTAPAVVLLHGTGGHWETFAPTIAALSKDFRCVAIDMVGNGFSGKPDVDYEIPVYIAHVNGVLAALGVTHAHFIGMSLGAWVVARMAQQLPDVVDSAILMSPAGLIA